MKYFASLFLIAALIACGTRKNQELQESGSDLSDEVPEVFDTLFVDQNMAVLWWPDSNDQVTMKENYDEISYNKFVDDMTWYTQNAVNMFDSMGIANKVTSRDFVVFKKSDNSILILKRKEVKGNMILLNKQKEPLIFSLDNYNRKQVFDYFR